MWIVLSSEEGPHRLKRGRVAVCTLLEDLSMGVGRKSKSGKREVPRNVAVEVPARKVVFAERKRSGWAKDVEVTSQADRGLDVDADGEGRTKDGAQLPGRLAGG